MIGVAGYSVGGEGVALFDALAEGGRPVACAALFPEIVGMCAVDVLADALAGKPMPAEIRTPHAVLDRASLGRYYHRRDGGWVINPAVAAELGACGTTAAMQANGRSIGFLPHYPAHDWYRNMAGAMQTRAAERGIALKIATPQAGIAHEIDLLRQPIARAAAKRVAPGDTILVNAA